MLRELFLRVAENERIQRAILHRQCTRNAARRFIAGETLAEAGRATRELARRGMRASIAHVGEHVIDAAQADASCAMHIETLRHIALEHLPANISVKLSQLGLDIDAPLCERHLENIAQEAYRLGMFVRIDMESSAYTERTLQLCTRIHKQYGNVGPVIQSYLYRSENDVRALLPLGIRMRLCKGAYQEGPQAAFRRKAEVDANFVRLAQLLLGGGPHHAIATHDPNMIDAVKAFAARESLPKHRFEFQMLYGIRSDLQQQLVREGYTVRIYVPFGEKWFGYFMRRLAERPANLMFFLSHLRR